MPQVVQIVDDQFVSLIANNAQLLLVVERLDKVISWLVAIVTCVTITVLWQFWGRMRGHDAV